MSSQRITPSELLQWSVLRHATANEDAPPRHPDEPSVPREPIDPKWIEVILGKPDAARMKECIDIIHHSEKSLDEKLLAFDELELLVESVDNANDLRPLKLWPLLLQVLSSEESQLRAYTAWVIGTALQNNPRAQRDVREEGGLLQIIPLLTDSDSKVRSKAIYAISSGIRHAPSNIHAFSTNSGFEFLFQSFSDFDHPPVLQKACMLLKSLLVNEDLKSGAPALVIQHMVQAGFVSTLLSVLEHLLSEEANWDEALWEAALGCLVAFHSAVSQYQQHPSLLTVPANPAEPSFGLQAPPVVSHSDSHIPDSRQHVLDIVEPSVVLHASLLKTSLPSKSILDLEATWNTSEFAKKDIDSSILEETRSMFKTLASQ